MALFLVQHGKSLSKQEDPEKGLSKDGVSTVGHMAELASGYGIKVSRIRHSGKKRARQTAQIFASALNPEQGVEEMSGLNPLDDVTALAPKIDSDAQVMLVGHLPFMEKLASQLITGSANTPVIRFQNGGIVCLEKDKDKGAWVIKWTLMPEIS